MATKHSNMVPFAPGHAAKVPPSRSAALERRAMQAALTAALSALRSHDTRPGGRRRQPPSVI